MIDVNHIKAGVVGVGRMGSYHVGVYSELFNVELVGIADINKERAEEIAKRYNTTAYTDYRELFSKVDIVSIAVPTESHYKIAKDFLKEKIHVLLEKPATKDLKEARELFKIAEERGVVLNIGHVERFNGAVQELKKIVSNPIFIDSRRLGPYDPRVENDGVVLDLMIHDIDIILDLVDSKIKEINAMGVSVFSGHEDLANVQIRFENGCIANIVASRATQNKIRTLAITQKDAYIFLDYTDQDIHIHRQASSEHTLTKEELRYKQESFIERIFVHKENPLKLEIKHLIDCVTNHLNNKKENSASIERELHSLNVALEIIEKFKKNRIEFKES
jgi:predicted dehydrogenase